MKYILLIIMCMFFISMASAESLGTFQQYTDIKLIQTCNNCTHCNFTVFDVNSAIIVNNAPTTNEGILYYYDLEKENLTQLGDYRYCYDCRNTNEIATGCINFNITPSGDKDLLGLMQLGL